MCMCVSVCVIFLGSIESNSNHFTGELSAKLSVQETRGATVQDKRCYQGGRGPAASSTECCSPIEDQVQNYKVCICYSHYTRIYFWRKGLGGGGG